MFKTIFFKLLPFIGGMAYALGAPSPYLPHHPLWAIGGMSIFLASLSLFSSAPTAHPWRDDLIAWGLFSLGLYLAGFNWIPGTMQDFGGISAGWSYLLGFCAAFILAPQVLVFIILLHFLNGQKRWPFKRPPKTRLSFTLLVWAIIWLLIENFLPQQFPYHLGHSWMRLAPYLGPATIGGEPLYSAAFTWLAMGIAVLLRQRLFDLWPWMANSILVLASLLTPLNNPYLDPQHGTPFNLRLVQGSIGNDLKARAEHGQITAMQEVQKIYYNLSTASQSMPLDLIIWPETAIHQPFNSLLLQEVPPANLPASVRQTVRQTNTALFAGGYDILGQAQFNSAFYFGFQAPTGINFGGYYHKIKLLAFGETLPFGPLNPYIFKWTQGLVSNFTAGTDYPVFTTSTHAHFITTICYEILLTHWLRHYLQRLPQAPDFMVNLTNDSWFGVTAEPAQHLFLAKWRAVELQKAIVRSTNSGISTIIYPDGQNGPELAINVRAILDQTIYLDPAHPASPTIYQRLGLGAVLGMAAILLIMTRLLAGRRIFKGPRQIKFIL